VIEEMVDEKVDCNDDDDADGFCDSGPPSYTVQPSGGLTLRFRSSPAPSPRPADQVRAADQVREVRVKLERCDDDADPETTPSKRCRLEDSARSSVSADCRPAESRLSEADAAVAGLLGCSDTTADSPFGRLHDGLDALSDEASDLDVDRDPQIRNPQFRSADAHVENSDPLIDDSTQIRNPDSQLRNSDQFGNRQHLTVENGISDPSAGTPVPAATPKPSDGEVMTAVNNLMVDLSQLNAVQHSAPNGLGCLSTAKLSMAKRTSSESDSKSTEGSGLGIKCAAVAAADRIFESGSSPFCGRVKLSDNDLDFDLDAAVKSILS